ncbi:XRE family transcriptional regulator [Pseudomonas sp. OTU5201]|uniref:XRE family transcriptional regulator n=1 Tax=Pseudomonas sp. OTU5201 TaxID=3043850 RepID=UPI00313EFA55
MDFPDRIRSRMQALHLGAAELAQLVGVSKGAVTHWTTGANKVSGKNLIALAKALECDVSWLVNDEGRTVTIGSYARTARASEAKDATIALILEMLKKHAGKSLNNAAKQRIAQALAENLKSSPLAIGESPLPASPRNAAREGEICIPHLDLQALAPDGKLPADCSEAVHSITVSQSFLREQGVNYTRAANLAVVTQWGQSMEGTINDRDPIIVDCGVTEFVGDGVYLFTWAGHLFIRSLQLAGNDQVEIVADNPVHKGRIASMGEVVIHASALLAWSARKL